MTRRGPAVAISTLAQRIASLPRPLLLAFDVDGTLAPIVEDPRAARVPPALARSLRALARHRGVCVALVTGRDARALARMLRVPGAFRALEHGRLVLAPGARAQERSPTRSERARLDAFEAWARAHASPAGARLERKPASRVVHVRALAAISPARARRLLEAAWNAARAAGLVVRPGRAVCEATLEHADKAEALERIARRVHARAVVYVGDDATDRAAIARAGSLGGLGLHVRSSERPRAPRGARAVLDGPGEVAELLNTLVRRLAPSPRAGLRARSARR